MKFLVAMDSFKGSLDAIDLVDIISKKIVETMPDSLVVKAPLADGGEGTIDGLITEGKGKKIYLEVNDPLMRKIKTYYGVLNDGTAIVEMSKASGLTLLKENEKNPFLTTTYGVGEIIKNALDIGARNFIIGIGGSATNDSGIGMLKALGMKFYDDLNEEVLPIGKSLSNIVRIDISNFDSRVNESQFLIACDVDNPLYGPLGAAYVYGPQKGADEIMVKELNRGLEHFSEIVHKTTNKDYAKLSGAGAAGGLGYAFKTFFDAELKPGIDIVFEKLDIESLAKNVDIIITGEGRIDEQSAMGKVLSGIGKIGLKYNIPVIAIAGSISPSAKVMHDKGITAMFSILNEPLSLAEALNKDKTKNMIRTTLEEILKIIIIKK